MILLNSIDNFQQFPIIPTKRIGNIYVDFIDEATKDIFTFQPSTIEYVDLFYVEINGLSLTLKENNFYTVRVYIITMGIEENIYIDRAFCTNQPKETFSINDGEYSFPNIDNNNYIII